MGIVKSTVDHIRIFKLSGNVLSELDSSPVINALQEEIKRGNTKIIIDLEEIKYINSTALGILLTALTKARNASGELLITNVSEQLDKLLIITKLNVIFDRFNTIEDALNYIKQRA